jgi:methyltransferase
MVTRRIFAGLVLLLAIQRLAELHISRQHEAKMLAQGGREAGAEHFGLMKAMHVSWFVSMLVEVFLLKRPFIPWLAGLASLFVALGQSLRLAAIRTLGWRWSLRIISMPEETPVQEGIYLHIRHPNYLGVILEILAVPLLHSAYLTSLVFSLLNAAMLRVRIRTEENAIYDYQKVFHNAPRFLPELQQVRIE